MSSQKDLGSKEEYKNKIERRITDLNKNLDSESQNKLNEYLIKLENDEVYKNANKYIGKQNAKENATENINKELTALFTIILNDNIDEKPQKEEDVKALENYYEEKLKEYYDKKLKIDESKYNSLITETKKNLFSKLKQEKMERNPPIVDEVDAKTDNTEIGSDDGKSGTNDDEHNKFNLFYDNDNDNNEKTQNK